MRSFKSEFDVFAVVEQGLEHGSVAEGSQFLEEALCFLVSLH